MASLYSSAGAPAAGAAAAAAAVFVKSEALPASTPTVQGYDFGSSSAVDYDKLLQYVVTCQRHILSFLHAWYSDCTNVIVGCPPADLSFLKHACRRSFATTGYQGTHFGRAISIVNKMLAWRDTSPPPAEGEEQVVITEEEEDLPRRVARTDKSVIFLGYTSNLVSSGLRDNFRFLCQHKVRSFFRVHCCQSLRWHLRSLTS